MLFFGGLKRVSLIRGQHYVQLGLLRMHGQEPEVLQEAGTVRGQGGRVQNGECIFSSVWAKAVGSTPASNRIWSVK